MRRIPPQRARIPATQSLSNTQSYNNKAKPAISGTSSFNQSRRNGPKSDNKAPEFCRRQGYCPTNDSSSAVGSLHDISDDDFDIDNRKTRHLENQTMVSEPLRHQSSSGPRTTSTFEQDSKKNASNGLPEQHTLPDYDDTLDEHWLSFSDQMEFDYKLDSDSAPEDSLSMRTSRKVPSDSSAETVSNNDTIGDIDKLLMEDISSPRLSPVLRPIMDARDCKRRRDVTEAKPKVKKHLVDSENKESHKVNDPGNSISDNDKYTERDNELKNRNKSEKDHGPGAQSNTSAQLDQSIICHDNDMIPAGMHPQLFNVPRTTMDFKSQLDGLSGGFMTSLSNMLEAVQNVDSLHASIKLAVLDRCSYLDDRGKSLHARTLDLHKEAGMLHSKATQGLVNSHK